MGIAAALLAVIVLSIFYATGTISLWEYILFLFLVCVVGVLLDFKILDIVIEELEREFEENIRRIREEVSRELRRAEWERRSERRG